MFCTHPSIFLCYIPLFTLDTRTNVSCVRELVVEERELILGYTLFSLIWSPIQSHHICNNPPPQELIRSISGPSFHIVISLFFSFSFPQSGTTRVSLKPLYDRPFLSVHHLPYTTRSCPGMAHMSHNSNFIFQIHRLTLQSFLLSYLPYLCISRAVGAVTHYPHWKTDNLEISQRNRS